jgi:hypothetical protein
MLCAGVLSGSPQHRSSPVPDQITWFGRTPESFSTRGAEVTLTPSGWVLTWNEGARQRARGPFRGGLDAAMDAWRGIRDAMQKAPSEAQRNSQQDSVFNGDI